MIFLSKNYMMLLWNQELQRFDIKRLHILGNCIRNVPFSLGTLGTCTGVAVRVSLVEQTPNEHFSLTRLTSNSKVEE